MITKENKAEAMFRLAEIHLRNAQKEQRLGNDDRQEQYLLMAETATKIAMEASGHGVEWFFSEAVIHEIG
jgi:hypothetical protein